LREGRGGGLQPFSTRKRVAEDNVSHLTQVEGKGGKPEVTRRFVSFKREEKGKGI